MCCATGSRSSRSSSRSSVAATGATTSEVLLIRRIRELLYAEGFTISGARNRLDNAALESDERAEAPARAAGGAGADLSAIRRELRALLEVLRP